MTELAVKKVTITDAEGQVKAADVPAIMSQQPSILQYRQMLVKVIADKNAKHAAYDGSLAHINLIIVDHVALLTCNEKEDFSKMVFDRVLRDEIAQSGFSEIFLVTNVNHQEVVIPLVCLAVITEFELLLTTLQRLEATGLEIEKSDLLPLFHRFLEARGYRPRMARFEDDFEVLLGNAGIVLVSDGIVIHDHADFALPQSCAVPSVQADVTMQMVLESYDEVVSEVVFVTTLMRDALGAEASQVDRPT